MSNQLTVRVDMTPAATCSIPFKVSYTSNMASNQQAMLDVYDTLNGILQVAAGVMSTLMVS
jgi:argininosuccinate lyase